MHARKMQAKKLMCVYCGKPKQGLPVKEDYVIQCIRWFNRKVLHKYRNYRLVVCKACYPGYKKSRSRYVRKQAAYLVIGFLFAGMLIAVSGGSAFAFLYGIAIIAFMYLLSIISYVPSLETERGRTKA